MPSMRARRLTSSNAALYALPTVSLRRSQASAHANPMSLTQATLARRSYVSAGTSRGPPSATRWM